MTPEQEIEILKRDAESLKSQLSQAQNFITALSNEQRRNSEQMQLLMSLFRDSSPTRIALHGQVFLDEQAFLGLFGAVPVPQNSAIADVTAGGTTDTNCRATVQSILTMLRTYGLIKT